MILHNMMLFEFICVQYQFHRQTLPIMKIDRGQIQFREYVSTGTEPKLKIHLGNQFKYVKVLIMFIHYTLQLIHVILMTPSQKYIALVNKTIFMCV